MILTEGRQTGGRVGRENHATAPEKQVSRTEAEHIVERTVLPPPATFVTFTICACDGEPAVRPLDDPQGSRHLFPHVTKKDPLVFHVLTCET